ncbi:ExeM/NucH family extracellular endonuclease [Tessaracoccus oleiagri]|uniref:LTD domain-containing protein n=1 Tax=Tessaracoccus oleiagri TaxID=686624 RepID=A0A1G9K200_9ACTN|nr:ExeM/NucH family extracellular endonuclease [Tessaracoccus oleiagri]SDL43506.1 hypothetical protein SAMN04488242_1584 [Tessaracoccus oleiagri]
MRSERKIWAGLLAAAVAGTTWLVPQTASAAASDLIISEYVEGSSFNKAIELFNGTESTIDLSQYRLALFSNGGTTQTASVTLTGTLAPGDVHVVAHGDATLGGFSPDQRNSSAINFNGDDAVVLYKGDAVIDSFGQVGVRANFGTDVTLVRNASVTAGDTNTTDAFSAAAEWASYPSNTFSYLGSHTMDGVTPGEDPTDPGEDPTDPVDQCELEATAIGAVQGSGDATTMGGQSVTVQGVVVGDFQTGGFNGYYLQDEGDDDPATSDGIFVFDRNQLAGDVAEGDVVRLTGTASEYFGMTQLTATAAVDCGEGALPEPTVIDFPNTDFERYEGMYVTFAEPLTILELYQYGRYGQIAVGPERQFQATALYSPETAEARAEYEANLVNRVLIDDGRSTQNPSAIHPATLEPLTMDTLFRAGDRIDGVAGVLDYRFDNWAIQPTTAGTIEHVNERPSVPEVGGDFQVGSFNVLNYFTTLGSRGAETAEEFERQEAKIVTAINKADAAIIALNEIENNGTAVGVLVEALNEAAGYEKWAALETGVIGTDEITTAFIYQPAIVRTVGDFDTLTSADDPRFDDTRSRPTLAQTFEHLASGELITVAANHLKSKGSACGDPSEATLGYLVGNCNETRTEAAEAMVDWLEGDTIGVEKTENILIVGDLNSYDHEDPIKVFEAAGYTDLTKLYEGERAYSYVFDGQLGYLDYALANEALLDNVTGTETWHINADELPLIDYTMKFKAPAEDALYAPDEFRSSDHDPVLVGVDFDEPQADLVLNEVKPTGRLAFVELLNAGDGDADLDGLTLTDGRGRTYELSGTLEAGAYLVLDQEDLGFKLRGEDTVVISDGEGAEVDSFAWEGAPGNGSYSLCDGEFVRAEATAGAINACVVDG